MTKKGDNPGQHVVVDAGSTPDASMEASTSSESQRRSLWFLVGSLAGGNLVSAVLRLVGGVLLGRLVAPATLGLFNGIGLVLGYAPFLQLGILNGLNRELPYFVGKGDRERVRELASAAQAWGLAVGGIVCIALLIVAGWYLAQGKFWQAAGWATNAVLGLSLFYSTHYLENTFRTSHDFARLSLVGVVENAAALLMLGAVAVLNFYGLCVRALVAAGVSTLLLYLWRPLRVKPKWSLVHLKHLLIIGAPIFAVGQLFAWWTLINSTLVLKMVGTEGMGLYSMVLIAGSTLELLPAAMTQVVYPRMAEEYGRSNSIPELRRIIRRPMVFIALGMVPVVALAWILVGPAVRLAVPAYAAAIPAMQWSLLMALVHSFQPLSSVFNVARRQDLYVAALGIGFAIYGLFLWWLTRGGPVLTAFPQAMLAGRAAYMLAVWVFVRYLCNRRPRSPSVGGDGFESRPAASGGQL
ncbi:MAG: lipopolysaccharide biosynthesis protein [Actinobacteria bacterium]|nr:lipopolysaccharide biosynthesis protein [Actinomycetota bacterium]